MKTWAIILSLGWFAVSAVADDKVAEVQQLLKNGGYYFGEITGQKDTDTTAAIRRYQIRNGLDISGELTDTTYKSIRSNTGNASPPPAVVSRAPSPSPPQPPPIANNDTTIDEETAAPPPSTYPRPVDRQPGSGIPGEPMPAPVLRGGFFAGTPYENAPPDVQQDAIMRAQKRLAARDMFRGNINGVTSPELEFSLRAYQARVGLQPTGRLDLQTLAALELLPGAGQPVYLPRGRPYRVAPGAEPPVRGEWIRP